MISGSSEIIVKDFRRRIKLLLLATAFLGLFLAPQFAVILGGATMAKFNDPFSLSPLSEKMRQDIELTGRGKRTQESYVRAVRKFSEFLKKCPNEASEDDLRNYLLFVKNEREWGSSTLNVACCVMKLNVSIRSQ